jgi:hypothetical protein
MVGDMDSDYLTSSPTRDQWLRLYAAVQPTVDVHPVQGWELGEYVALMKVLWEENLSTMTSYIYMYIVSTLRRSRPAVFDHLEDGCSDCLERMQALVGLLGLPTGASVREVRSCVSCQQDSPFAALFCVRCGRRIRDLHVPFFIRSGRRLA